jgi:hypothetical protein
MYSIAPSFCSYLKIDRGLNASYSNTDTRIISKHFDYCEVTYLLCC